MRKIAERYMHLREEWVFSMDFRIVFCIKGGEYFMKRIIVTVLSTMALVLFAAGSSFASAPITHVPEPSSLMLLGTGVAGIWVFRKLRK
jgi:hypothetical protein